MTTPDDIRTMYTNNYLGAWDLQGRDVTVTIERIDGGIVEGENGRKDKAPIVHFVETKGKDASGKKKPMVLNKTNLKTIAAIYGTFSKTKLVGKRITLYATKTKAKGGEIVDCVRVRPTKPPDGKDTEMPEVPMDTEMRAKQVAAMDGSDNPDEGP